MAKGHKIFEGERGHPENKGNAMEHVHPVIRTNPVTGWKAVYAVGSFASRINELTPAESELVLNWLMDVINRNHDLAWHLRWNNKNDMGMLTLTCFELLFFANTISTERWTNRMSSYLG